MKYLLIILLLISVAYGQQMGGSGQDNGYYKSESSLYLAADSITTCTNGEVWYSINARLIDGHDIDFNTVNGVGLIYTGVAQKEIMFMGTANAYTNKSGEVTLQLVVGSDTVDGAKSTAYFHGANQHNNFCTNRFLDLSANDTIKFFMKSNTASTNVTMTEMNISAMQIH
jgi:hypothetical protein